MKNSFFKKYSKLTLASFVFTALIASLALAETTNLTLTVNPGTLATEIRDGSGVAVSSPAVAFTSASTDFSCASSTATLGTSTERIYVDNPDNADAGWSLTIAPTSGSTAVWTGSTSTFDFNDSSSSGCADSADADSKAGLLSVDPSGGSITAVVGATTDVSLGSSANFASSASITLLSAASTSDDIGQWYLTDVDLTQTIPANQTAESYALDMTLTVTAV